MRNAPAETFPVAPYQHWAILALRPPRFALGFSLSRFWVSSTGIRWIVSALAALAAAFFLPWLFRKRSQRIDTYVIMFILIAWVVSESFYDVP